MSADRAELLARIDALELESRRAFEDAQREADALFAQYQLSQLVASGGSLGSLARSVTLEVVRLAGVDRGAVWLAGPDGPELALLASVGAAEPPREDPAGEAAVPTVVSSIDDGRRWCAGLPGARSVVLSDEPPGILLCLWALDGRTPDADGIRVVQSARHEVVVAFRSARLRETLERERGELTAVVDGTTDLILQVDAERRVVRLNPAGERLLGIDVADALGRTCAEVLGCAVAGGHGPDACPLLEVMTTGQPMPYQETAIRGADGSSIRVAGGYSAVARTGSDGRPPLGRAQATAIVRDISAIRALEELREGFVATVSHELRTPLSLIRGYAETLLHLDLEPAEQRAYVERIDEVTGRLSALVGQILDVTHLQADPLILERAPVSFAALVARLRGDLETSGRADRLLVDLPTDLPPLEVDAARVGQILENLVENAFKYGPPEGSIDISATVEGDWLLVAVEDEGVGIPATERALVTEPFHRAWNVRESRIPGTGLGLYICRRLVEAHGGRLRLEDRPDGRPGTRVAFTLPLLRSRRPDPARTRRRAQPPAPAAVDGG
jgi:signal transduction histidine kinase